MEQNWIPFDIKYRPEIEAGKYLVVTRAGKPVKIRRWDRGDDTFPILALVEIEQSGLFVFTEKGKYNTKGMSTLDLFLVPTADYKEPTAESSEDSEKDIIVSVIKWTGNNLKEVIDFTGKSPRFGEWFKSWEEFENYVHTHNDILKLFCEDGSHYEVPVGAWIVKTPDGHNVPSVAKYIQHEQPSEAAVWAAVGAFKPDVWLSGDGSKYRLKITAYHISKLCERCFMGEGPTIYAAAVEVYKQLMAEDKGVYKQLMAEE